MQLGCDSKRQNVILGKVHLLFSTVLFLVLRTINSDCCCCSVAQLCPTLCDLMDCSTPGFPVLHHLLEFVQTHVHWVDDTIQPSHPLLPLSPPAFNLSQHQDLCPIGCVHSLFWLPDSQHPLWWQTQHLRLLWVVSVELEFSQAISSHLMQRSNSLKKTVMLGKSEGRRKRGWQRVRWLHGITDSMDISLSKL